jgi:ribonuclease HI
MHLAHLLRSSKQRYMQFLPVLITIGAHMHNMTICICSDSKAALLALSSYTISSKLLHQCWLLLQDLSNNNRVRLFWVPGHCDIKGNEEADRLARMGSDFNCPGFE